MVLNLAELEASVHAKALYNGSVDISEHEHPYLLHSAIVQRHTNQSNTRTSRCFFSSPSCTRTTCGWTRRCIHFSPPPPPSACFPRRARRSFCRPSQSSTAGGARSWSASPEASGTRKTCGAATSPEVDLGVGQNFAPGNGPQVLVWFHFGATLFWGYPSGWKCVAFLGEAKSKTAPTVLHTHARIASNFENHERNTVPKSSHFDPGAVPTNVFLV